MPSNLNQGVPKSNQTRDYKFWHNGWKESMVWKAPMKGPIKINFDTSTKNWVGMSLGFIVRDVEGYVLASTTKLVDSLM